MKIYVADRGRDDSEIIFADKSAALAELESDPFISSVAELELHGTKFEPTGDSVFKWSCCGCNKHFISTQQMPFIGWPQLCSAVCEVNYRKSCAEHEATLRERYAYTLNR